jgi:hypothetical protein
VTTRYQQDPNRFTHSLHRRSWKCNEGACVSEKRGHAPRAVMRAEGARSSESRDRRTATGTRGTCATARTRSGASRPAPRFRERYWMAKLAERFGMIPRRLRGRPRGDSPDAMRRYDSALARYAARYARKHPLSRVAMAITKELLHRVPALGRSRLRRVAQLARGHSAPRMAPRAPRRPRARVARPRRTAAARPDDPPGPPSLPRQPGRRRRR